ncbi:spermatogenesis-associated protein 7 homolog [Chamaea fasciata]|uniref:spermatogenesis-associated protein 7 homolog n=1 Tax=Chamaea fasciata TaxID=190680 RepID=UPI00336AC487
MVPTYSLMGPFRGHMSLKSSPFSPGPSCKLSNQYIIQDHMAAHFKKLMSSKAAVDSSAPKSLHTSVKYRDQQKRDRLIQALEKYKKDLVPDLPASPVKCRSISPSQEKRNGELLENCHPLSGQSNYRRTKTEQPLSVSRQKFTSRTLMLVPAARKTIPKTALCPLSQTPVDSPSAHRSSASPLLQPHVHLGSHSRKKKFQNSVHKTYSGDLLDKHAIYFTEKKQCFTPRILKTLHQAFLVKYRYYNPPSRKRSSSPGRPSTKSAVTNNKKREGLHRFLEDAHMRPHSAHFSQQPVEVSVPSELQRKKARKHCSYTKNHELWSHDSEMPLSPGLQLEELEEEYLCFLQDLTNDILIRSCYQKEALEDVFQMHIKSKRHNLDEVKMRRIVQSLKEELNIINDLDPPISCGGTMQKDASIPATCF